VRATALVSILIFSPLLCAGQNAPPDKWCEYVISESRNPAALWLFKARSVMREKGNIETLALLEAAARPKKTPKPPTVQRILLDDKNELTVHVQLEGTKQIKVQPLPVGELQSIEASQVKSRTDLPKGQAAGLLAARIVHADGASPIAGLGELAELAFIWDKDPKVLEAISPAADRFIELLSAACAKCAGSGEDSCKHCQKGKVGATADCANCHGKRETNCQGCHGDGRVECPNCGGDGRVQIGRAGGGALKTPVFGPCHNCRDGTLKCTRGGCREGRVVCRACGGDGDRQVMAKCTECKGSNKTKCESCDGNRTRDAMDPAARKAAEEAAAGK
jgi:hypothetical protein